MDSTTRLARLQATVEHDLERRKRARRYVREALGKGLTHEQILAAVASIFGRKFVGSAAAVLP
jgi:hypothetical protein